MVSTWQSAFEDRGLGGDYSDIDHQCELKNKYASQENGLNQPR